MAVNPDPMVLDGGRSTTWVLPWSRPPLTTNEAKRGNNVAHSRITRDVRAATRFWARSQNIPTQPRADVLITWWAPDRRSRDAGSLSTLLKAVLDGLVDAGVWPDDDWRWVRTEACRVEPPTAGERSSITLTISPAPAPAPAAATGRSTTPTVPSTDPAGSAP